MRAKGQGLAFASLQAADPQFFAKKKAIEAELGHEITSNEFIEKYYTPPKNKGIAGGTSVFDPVLCELAYSWYTNAGDAILDPFAGGSVRGLVATLLDRKYTGVDLSETQIDTNRQIAGDVLEDETKTPNWIVGDSCDIDKLVKGKFDFIFTCPPYGDLEQYSDDPSDLSNMSSEDFDKAYEEILKKSVAKLKDDRFLVIVVGNYRDKNGYLIDLVGKTVQCIEKAGARYYNDVIVRTPLGSAPTRASKQFDATRKIVKVHQYFLVFVKGDPKAATSRLDKIDTKFLDNLINEYIERRKES